MGFFDELQAKLTAGSKVVVAKTKQAKDTMKLNVQISSEERKIDAIYTQIGKAYFEANRETGSVEFAEEFEEIMKSLETIEACKAELEAVKTVKEEVVAEEVVDEEVVAEEITSEEVVEKSTDVEEEAQLVEEEMFEAEDEPNVEE